jgi:hypothetical protein
LLSLLLSGKNFGQDLDYGIPTSLLANALRLGHTICTDLEEEPDVVVCVDFEGSSLSLLRKAHKMGVPRVLIKQEPVVVFPQHKSRNPKNLFELVITKGMPSGLGKYNYGNSWPSDVFFEERRKARFVAVTANKWSAIPGQLYDLRTQVYSTDPRVDVYGRGWDSSKFEDILMFSKEVIIASRSFTIPRVPKSMRQFRKPLSYLGEIEDKRTVMSLYEWSLIIENCPFYVSEKLLDSLLLGNIPVYVGGDLDGLGIPAEFVYRAEPTIGDVRRAMDRATQIDPKEYRRKLSDWLNDPRTRENWDANIIWAKVLKEIEEFALRNRGTFNPKT